MEQHKNYIVHDMKQRHIQRRALPEDYPTIQPEVVAAAKPARDDVGERLCLMPGYHATRADQVVKTLRKASHDQRKGAVKSMAAKKPDGTNITVTVGPTVCARTLSLADAPDKEGTPYPCGACPAHTPVVPVLPTPLWCLQISIIRGLSV